MQPNDAVNYAPSINTLLHCPPSATLHREMFLLFTIPRHKCTVCNLADVNLPNFKPSAPFTTGTVQQTLSDSHLYQSWWGRQGP